MIKSLYILSVLIITLSFGNTTDQYHLDEEVSFIYINGTSTLHDWTAFANKMSGVVQIDVETKRIVKINSAKISVPVNSLKSGKDLMDKNIQEALKAKAHPEIVYQLKSHVVHNGEITVKGELTIAGVSKTIETIVNQKDAGKHIEIRGSLPLKMTDFNVKPPEFLLGAFKTGDEVSVKFYFMFHEKKTISHE